MAASEEGTMLWQPGDDDADVWDDSELIEAYDQAVKTFLKRKQPTETPNRPPAQRRRRNQQAEHAVVPSPSPSPAPASMTPIVTPSSENHPMPPPAPPLPPGLLESNPAACNLMLSWYHSGYWTGYFAGLEEENNAPPAVPAT
eukprot:NODE_2085_length_646_cov_48.098827_g1636_i0.p1 GENE.NODE_2085_length_646_cov_48.098827_g1636_i0~~NODE_2085_length_646_cov_48.098827_g1636_i0.p1  ORF type:complete len:143 (+),score=36.97 NODE_2085_length_646_cov_48.098827_g1636_i0:124-552(+)